MMTEDDWKTAEELKVQLLAQGKEKICRLILYGSRARGTASPDSDFDLLVIEADPVSKLDEMRRLRQAIDIIGFNQN